MDGDEIRVVLCHNLWREALIHRSLEETQSEETLHTGHFFMDWSLFAAAKVGGTKAVPLTGIPSSSVSEATALGGGSWDRRAVSHKQKQENLTQADLWSALTL